ncbi:MAG: transporter ATP-binding protein [Actinomycetota bacterium]|jgi:ABC-2 type transport system ATP-binding protein|nr:transporter ATP-binding protein [Actinomycetota bacterium]
MSALATFENLTKRYGSGVAVDDLSFEVPDGQVCGLLGPNGAGKTTAIRVLLGLAEPTSGSTTLLGVPPGHRTFGRAVRRVGTLIEGPALFSRATARQNMQIEADALGLDQSRARIDDLLKLVDLGGRADTRCGSFSLGMKQRLGLAISLMGDPRLVVLDEPTNGLDPAGIVEIRQLIEKLPERGTTVLVSSHLLAEIQLMCDRAAILQRGRLVADGTIADLISGGGNAGFSVRVDPSLTEQTAATLSRAGLRARPGEAGTIDVTGEIENGMAISQPLAEAGIYVWELTPGRADLEQAFLRLTDESDKEETAMKAPADPALAIVGKEAGDAA